MGSKLVGGLLDSVLDELSEVGVFKPSIRPSLVAAKGPFFGWFGHDRVAVSHHNLLEHVDIHVIYGLQVWETLF